jgi:hypothetical protein
MLMQVHKRIGGEAGIQNGLKWGSSCKYQVAGAGVWPKKRGLEGCWDPGDRQANASIRRFTSCGNDMDSWRESGCLPEPDAALGNSEMYGLESTILCLHLALIK